MFRYNYLVKQIQANALFDHIQKTVVLQRTCQNNSIQFLLSEENNAILT